MNTHEIDSPNHMQIDSNDFTDGQNERDEDVAIIDSDGESVPKANDYEAIKNIVLVPLLEEPPILEDAHHTWEITRWDEQPKKTRGPIFHAGGHPWRVLMFAKGNNVDHASFYLEHGYGDEEGQEPMPENFVCCLQFSLVLWNPDAPWVYTHHTAHHRFTKEEGDWGFTRFIELRKLWSTPWDESGRCMAEGKKANMTAYVRVVEDETGVLWHNFTNYDSKAETGFVGLKNQGATCYLNSLIQSLYFTNAFRKAVYQIPTQEEDSLTNSAFTLQRLFYQLQTANSAVSTSELTKSFGWETRHIFEQQDVQELSRKLMERMEEKMKGTEAEDVLPKLFCGKVRTYISCIGVEYESRRVEDFWDIQLNVHNNKGIEESFKDYIQEEVMNGDNQYYAGDEHKLQDAKKGVIFESFPEVLHLQLKRFQYDFQRDAMTKLNDRYEFPETFDASPYLADDADKSEPYIYRLHSVLIHSGDLTSGHYYAYIKPEKEGWFYKYDDDKVAKATKREVWEESFGGEYLDAKGVAILRKAQPVMKQNSAYMLVYIRETRLDNVLLPVTQADTPAHLELKLQEEAAARVALRKEKEEQHLYMTVKVITEESFKAYGGTDLTNFAKDAPQDEPGLPRVYRRLKKSTLNELITQLGEDVGIDPKRLRLWSLVNRQNKTIRPDVPCPDNALTIDETYQRMSGSRIQELRLWLEQAEETNAEGEGIWPATPLGQSVAPPKNDLIVILLKEFNLEQQTLSGVGHIYISKERRVEELVPAILKKMDWPEKTPLKLFEEIKPIMVEAMKAKQSLKAAEIQDGDIVCFQRVPSANGSENSDNQSLSDKSSIKSEKTLQSSKSGRSGSVASTTTTSSNGTSGKKSVSSSSLDRITNAIDYYEFLQHKRIVYFAPHPVRCQNKESYQKFSLAMSSKISYDQVAARVGNEIDVDPTHIRFWTVNTTNGNPKTAVKRGAGQTLHGVLNPPYSAYNNGNQQQDSLFFEVLDISLAELDTKKPVKISWLSEGISKETIYDVLVPKVGNIDDLVQALIKKAGLDDEATAGPIRILEVHSSKIHRESPRDQQVTQLNDYVTVYAERVPEEDLGPGVDAANDFVQAFHFQGEPSKSHGVPFKFRLIPNELFVDTKKRLEKRTGIKGKNFEKIKFAVVKRSSYSRPAYLNDDSVLDEQILHEDECLGLDHTDRSRVVRNAPSDLTIK